VALAVTPPAAAARAEIIDRILAVVTGHVIMLSDVRAAVDFGLVEVAHATDPQRAALDRLIERRLVLDEVERYVVAEPSADEIDRRLTAARARFPSETHFAAALELVGFTEADLQQVVRDDARIGAYLRERFGSAGQPSEEEVLAYYQANPEQFRRDGMRRPFSAARDEARQLVAEQQRQQLIDEWVAGLARRAEIVRPGESR